MVCQPDIRSFAKKMILVVWFFNFLNFLNFFSIVGFHFCGSDPTQNFPFARHFVKDTGGEESTWPRMKARRVLCDPFLNRFNFPTFAFFGRPVRKPITLGPIILGRPSVRPSSGPAPQHLWLLRRLMSSISSIHFSHVKQAFFRRASQCRLFILVVRCRKTCGVVAKLRLTICLILEHFKQKIVKLGPWRGGSESILRRRVKVRSLEVNWKSDR